MPFAFIWQNTVLFSITRISAVQVLEFSMLIPDSIVGWYCEIRDELRQFKPNKSMLNLNCTWPPSTLVLFFVNLYTYICTYLYTYICTYVHLCTCICCLVYYVFHIQYSLISCRSHIPCPIYCFLDFQQANPQCMFWSFVLSYFNP